MHGMLVFEQNPFIPTCRAWFISWLEEKTLTMRITALGLLFNIRRDAVNPSSPGMLKSITVRQGLVCPCFSTASPPSAASQTTFQFSLLSIKDRSARRNGSWSSTISNRAKACLRAGKNQAGRRQK
jgi:hypothetical protein